MADTLPDLEEAMKLAAGWLLRHQDAQTGGWGNRPGDAPNIINTAEALIAVLDAGSVEPGDQRIQKALKFLKEGQIAAGPDTGGWPRRIHTADGTRLVPDLVRSSFAVTALVKGGTGVDSDPVVRGLDWLAGRQNADGGWGASRGSPTGLLPTALALQALLTALPSREQGRPAIDRGLAALVGLFRNADGSFGRTHGLVGAHTILAAAALQSARRAGLPFQREEEKAIDWLLDNGDQANRLAEETVCIDPPGGQADYGFLITTDCLLVGLLANAPGKRRRNSNLAAEALRNLGDRLDPSGGFYGHHVFSWSTAKALLALAAARTTQAGFPRRASESGLTAGSVIAWFAVLLTAASVALAFLGKLGVAHMGFFMFLMLCLMLAHGAIGEQTFKDLVGKLPGLSAGKGKP